MGTLAAVSFVGALLEAFFLVLISAVALALIAGDDLIGPVAGYTVELSTALAAGGVALVAQLALKILGVRVSAHLTADVTAAQRRELSHAYLKASWAAQHDAPAGRLQSLLTTLVQYAANAITTLTNATVALLSLIAFLGTGLFVDAAATGAVLIALAVVGAILIPLRRRIKARSRTLQRANLDFANAVSELGALGMEMQTFGVQDRFVERIDELTETTTQTQRRVQSLTGILSPVYMSLAYAAVLAGVAVLALLQFGRLEAVGAVMLLMLRSLSYGQQLASAAGSLASQAPAIERLRQAVDQYVGAPAADGAAVPTHVAPLVADNVTFSYGSDHAALSNVTFSIAPGEVIGVIGPSGAGKSTLAQLLLGLREPDQGSLEVSGVRLQDVERHWWSDRVAFVAQDANLITGTVAENIRFFRDDINDEALRDSAVRANVLRDIEALPHTFDAHLGERGSRLSGGQRQRISIARALAGDPELLILDEPTSALDGRSEGLIRDTLGALRGKVTVVIIAHRMSTLDICDRIMVIEDGRLTALGTPSELSRSSDFYRNAMATAGISTDVAGV
ncbi:ATP-binding cassette domain-containing protein [Nostocoides sp. F2B08]|nr:ATP-binding cassette domain-containing protein [Tetrasphaera sp. F2B08]